MKAAVLNRVPGKFEIEEIEIDAPRGREVLVEVKASGLCHSDLHLAENDFGFPLPTVLGHELSGIVMAVGPAVTEFNPGDRVAGSLLQYCGQCLRCLAGESYFCDNPGFTQRDPIETPRLTRAGEAVIQFFGISAFAEKVLVHENQLAKIPDAVPFPQASVLGCGCVTGAGAVINSANVKVGESIAVFGVGGVGLNVVNGARLAGATRIIAVDLAPAKEQLARKFGATHFVNAGEGDPIAKIQEITGGGVDHAFEVIGLVATTRQAVLSTRRGGTAYLIGAHAPGKEITFDIGADLMQHNRTIRPVFMGSSNIKRDIPMFAELYLQGRFNLDDLISQEISLAQINEAYEQLKKGEIVRSVITSF